ncbi:MAG: PKD domain-containing protein [Bacteroidales bacterium]|nr:PKD domain-containing protein [Bacteroidales bacterium]
MTDKAKYKDIEDLFRAKLGEREVPVSGKVWSGLARKLRFREFMQYNPGSFNIYYLAGIIVAAAAVSIAVLTGQNSDETAESPRTIISTDTLATQTHDVIIERDMPDQSEEIEVVTGTSSVNESLIDNTGVVEETKESELSDQPAVAKAAERIKEGDPAYLQADNKIAAETKAVLAPVARFMPDRSEGCAPLSIYLKNLSHHYDSCLWEFGDGGISMEKNPVWVYDEEGEYEIKLILFGENGSRAIAKQSLTVYPAPVARFEVSEGNPFIPDEEIRFYNYSRNSVEWEWDFGDGSKSNEFEPVHFYDKAGSYSVTLKAISQFGCIDSMVITNAFGDNSCFIKFPNAFVPNQGGPTGGYYSARSDEQEEVFHPVWSGVTSYSLRIYSRRGILVFETDDIEIGWDGYLKGEKAEPGVYIWKARGMFKNGETFVKGGDLTLLPKW